MVRTKNTIYNRWCHMKERCNNPKRKDYKNYGGKGVMVDPEWDLWYECFESWFNNAYKRYLEEHDYIHPSNLAIDRINPDGPYSPYNCRLITRSENASIANRARWAKYKEAKNANRN